MERIARKGSDVLGSVGRFPLGFRNALMSLPETRYMAELNVMRTFCGKARKVIQEPLPQSKLNPRDLDGLIDSPK